MAISLTVTPSVGGGISPPRPPQGGGSQLSYEVQQAEAARQRAEKAKQLSQPRYDQYGRQVDLYGNLIEAPKASTGILRQPSQETVKIAGIELGLEKAPKVESSMVLTQLKTMDVSPAEKRSLQAKVAESLRPYQDTQGRVTPYGLSQAGVSLRDVERSRLLPSEFVAEAARFEGKTPSLSTFEAEYARTHKPPTQYEWSLGPLKSLPTSGYQRWEAKAAEAYRERYGAGAQAAASLRRVGAEALAPLRVLEPTVGFKDIRGIEWGMGAAQAAMYTSPLWGKAAIAGLSKLAPGISARAGQVSTVGAKQIAGIRARISPVREATVTDIASEFRLAPRDVAVIKGKYFGTVEPTGAQFRAAVKAEIKSGAGVQGLGDPRNIWATYSAKGIVPDIPTNIGGVRFTESAQEILAGGRAFSKAFEAGRIGTLTSRQSAAMRSTLGEGPRGVYIKPTGPYIGTKGTPLSEVLGRSTGPSLTGGGVGVTGGSPIGVVSRAPSTLSFGEMVVSPIQRFSMGLVRAAPRVGVTSLAVLPGIAGVAGVSAMAPEVMISQNLREVSSLAGEGLISSAQASELTAQTQSRKDTESQRQIQDALRQISNVESQKPMQERLKVVDDLIDEIVTQPSEVQRPTQSPYQQYSQIVRQVWDQITQPTPITEPTPVPRITETPVKIPGTILKTAGIPFFPPFPFRGFAGGLGGGGGDAGGYGSLFTTGEWKVKGYPVYGPDPLTGKIVGQEIGRRAIPYGAVEVGRVPKRRLGIVGSKRSSNKGSAGRALVPTRV